ncbi:MAG: hypothetical protein ACOY3Y_03125 [Acidobacteriota bacterium]
MRRSAMFWISSGLMVVAVGLAADGPAVFEDPQGRFIIDLPEGWAVKPPGEGVLKNDLITEFDTGGKTLTLAFNPGVADPDRLIRHCANQFKFLQVEFDGPVSKMAVNGHDSRWGVLKTPLDPGMVVFCGSLAFEPDGIYVFSVVRVDDLPAHRDKIESAFRSLRLQGESVGETSEITEVAPPPAPRATTAEWTCDAFSMTLAAGWIDKPIPRGFEKEVKGWFANEALDGVTGFVVHYKGLGMTMGKAFDAGMKSLTIPTPSLQPVEAEEAVLGGNKANVAVLRGPVAGAGGEVQVAGVVVTIKARKGFVNVIVMGPAGYQADLKAQAKEMAGTIR